MKKKNVNLENLEYFDNDDDDDGDNDDGNGSEGVTDMGRRTNTVCVCGLEI